MLVDSEAAGSFSSSLNIPDFYNADLDTEGEWDMPYISPSGEIDVHSSFLAYFTVIPRNYV